MQHWNIVWQLGSLKLSMPRGSNLMMGARVTFGILPTSSRKLSIFIVLMMNILARLGRRRVRFLNRCKLIFKLFYLRKCSIFDCPPQLYNFACWNCKRDLWYRNKVHYRILVCFLRMFTRAKMNLHECIDRILYRQVCLDQQNNRCLQNCLENTKPFYMIFLRLVLYSVLQGLHKFCPPKVGLLTCYLKSKRMLRSKELW